MPQIVDFDFYFAFVFVCFQKIRWDGAELCCLGLSETRMFDDAFIIYPVREDHMYNVRCVKGLMFCEGKVAFSFCLRVNVCLFYVVIFGIQIVILYIFSFCK